MSEMAAPIPDRVVPGQTWLSSGGTQWRVRKRRSRASGFTEVLIESTRGATRWVIDSDVREAYTFLAES